MSSSMPPLTPEEMASMSAAPPPPGQVSNLIDPPSLSRMSISVTAVFMSLATVIVVLRLYTRIVVLRKPGWDDWFMLAGSITSIALDSVSIAAWSAGGLGTHMWDTPIIAMVDPGYTNRLVATQFLYPTASCFVKISVLLLLRRVFVRGLTARLSVAIHAAMGAVTVFTVIVLALYGVWCVPRPQDHGQNPPTCFTYGLDLSIAAAAFNMLLDLYIFMLPLKVIWNLHATKQKKLGIIAVLGTGLLACICSLLTLCYRVSTLHTTDPSWDYVPAFILGGLEVNIGIVTASLPCLPALYRHVAGKETPSTAVDPRTAGYALKESASRSMSDQRHNSSRNDYHHSSQEGIVKSVSIYQEYAAR